MQCAQVYMYAYSINTHFVLKMQQYQCSTIPTILHKLLRSSVMFDMVSGLVGKEEIPPLLVLTTH